MCICLSHSASCLCIVSKIIYICYFTVYGNEREWDSDTEKTPKKKRVAIANLAAFMFSVFNYLPNYTSEKYTEWNLWLFDDGSIICVCVYVLHWIWTIRFFIEWNSKQFFLWWVTSICRKTRAGKKKHHKNEFHCSCNKNRMSFSLLNKVSYTFLGEVSYIEQKTCGLCWSHDTNFHEAKLYTQKTYIVQMFQ